MNTYNSTNFVRKLSQIQWFQEGERENWANDLEAGKVLHFNALPFKVQENEKYLFVQDILDPKARNISLDSHGKIKGVNNTLSVGVELDGLILRFREHANQLINSAFPKYSENLRLAPTSFRPKEVETRRQSIRADDKRLHVDAFPSRPNQGERILRVFLNINPHGKSRVWRIGEPFEDIAQKFVPIIKKYHPWRARLLKALRVTKSLRSEYDHLMLGIHDQMKQSDEYQVTSEQITYEFESGSVWVCFSDQTAHAAMSGQFMMEQTYHLPVSSLYTPSSSPLGILQRQTNRELI
jgi:hypothetical protein